MEIYEYDILEYFDLVKDSHLQPYVLIHGCNCVGAYNSGIAKQIRIKYPQAYKSYLEHIKNTDISNLLGSINQVKVGETGIIINAFTQRFYGRNSGTIYVDYKAIEKVFKLVKVTFSGYAIIYPMIGAGLGNGDWNQIKNIIDNILDKEFNILFIY